MVAPTRGMIDILRIFNDSYARLATALRSRVFFEDFYRRLLARGPHLAEHFRDTDWERQQAMLEKSFHHVLSLFVTNKVSDYLAEIADRHGPAGLNVRAADYDLWLDALVDTVEQHDPDFDGTVALAWHMVFAEGVAFMKHAVGRAAGSRVS